MSVSKDLLMFTGIYCLFMMLQDGVDSGMVNHTLSLVERKTVWLPVWVLDPSLGAVVYCSPRYISKKLD